MSLTTGRGPLGPKPAGRFTGPVPAGGVAYVEPLGRRLRGVKDGRTIIDSEEVLLVHRPGRAPVCAVPEQHVSGIDGAAVPEAPGHVEVPWDAVDGWLEEDEPVVGHLRNPYHRVDCVRTTRRLRVAVGDVVLVDTTETMAVFETSLPRRLYVAREHVRTDLLEPSATRTHCPYKGFASYWHAVVDDVRIADAAWSYDDPLPECRRIAGMLSFYENRVDLTAG